MCHVLHSCACCALRDPFLASKSTCTIHEVQFVHMFETVIDTITPTLNICCFGLGVALFSSTHTSVDMCWFVCVCVCVFVCVFGQSACACLKGMRDKLLVSSLSMWLHTNDDVQPTIDYLKAFAYMYRHGILNLFAALDLFLPKTCS